MNVLFDTNVVLDVLLRRETWLADAERLWKAAEEGRVRAFVCASSITDIFYICRKLIGAGAARGIVQACLDRLEIVAVTRDLLDAAYRQIGVSSYRQIGVSSFFYRQIGDKLVSVHFFAPRQIGVSSFFRPRQIGVRQIGVSSFFRPRQIGVSSFFRPEK